MIYILENNQLKVKVSSMGAELQSIRRKEPDTEYLWQGDPAFWSRRATNQFPICGRLVDGKYLCDGTVYRMDCHGFAQDREWTVVHQKATVLTLHLQWNEDTLAMYPFRFAMEITYTLNEAALSVTTIVRNLDDKTLPFAIGGHPGFQVPLGGEGTFEDYYVEFDAPCHPRLLGLDDAVLATGEWIPYPLEEDVRLWLQHSLFDRDALFFADAAPGLTLRSREGTRWVHVSYPDMKYVGLWHTTGSRQAPFLCVEPITGSPSRAEAGIVPLEEKPDIILLTPENVYRNTYTMTFG